MLVSLPQQARQKMQRASKMRPFGGARSLANAAKRGRANVNFSDFQNAYRPKTTAEIVNSIACFTACEQPWILVKVLK